MTKNKGGRPSGEKTRCDGQWTEAKFNSFIKSLLRQGTRRWAPIQNTKKEARVSRGLYECNTCKRHVAPTYRDGRNRKQNIFVDHIDTIVPTVEGFTTWDDVIERMFCEKQSLQLLCKDCHDKKSQGEKEERRKHRNWESLTPEYNSWRAMRARCLFKSHEAYDRYGGSGITIDPSWVDDFDKFKSDMGPRPEGYTLDRIDNSKGYFPKNCRWSSYKEQANNRSTNVYLELDGRRETISNWSRELGIPVGTITSRLNRGDSDERALSKDYLKKKKPSKVFDDVSSLILDGVSDEIIRENLGSKYHKDTIRKEIAKQRRASERS